MCGVGRDVPWDDVIGGHGGTYGDRWNKKCRASHGWISQSRAVSIDRSNC